MKNARTSRIVSEALSALSASMSHLLSKQCNLCAFHRLLFVTAFVVCLLVSAGIPAAHAAPGTPTMRESTGVIGGVYLEWQRVNEAELDHYNVYRSTTSAFTPSASNLVGSRNRLNSFSVGYQDNNDIVPGTTYYYRVTGADDQGNESAPTDEVSATPLAIPTMDVPALFTTDNSGNWEPGQLLYREVGFDRQGVIAYMNGNIYMGRYAGSSMRSWKWSEENDPSSLFMDLDETSGDTIGISVSEGTHGYGNIFGQTGSGVRYLSPGVNDANESVAMGFERTRPPEADQGGGSTGTNSSAFPWLTPHNWNQYGGSTGYGYIFRGDELVAEWDASQSGVIGPTLLIGNLFFVCSDNTNSGVAVYDISPVFDDPAGDPVLLDKLSGAYGGYLPAIWENYIVLPTVVGSGDQAGLIMVDYSDPSNLRVAGVIEGQISQPGNQYVQFQDNYGFIFGNKINMDTKEVELVMDGLDPTNRPDATGSFPSLKTPPDPENELPGDVLNTSQYNLPIGNFLLTAGYGTNDQDGIGLWVHQDEPDATRPTVGYHIPRPNATNYPIGAPITVMVHETLEMYTVIYGQTVKLIQDPDGSATQVDCFLSFAHDDRLTLTPKEYLQTDTEYEVQIVDNGIHDAAGNGIEGYSFRFSTGNTEPSGNKAPEITVVNIGGTPAEPGDTVTIDITANDPEGSATLEYRVSWGDGNQDDWTDQTTNFSHIYNESGHYEVKVDVREADQTALKALELYTITVAPLVTGTLPTRSSPIALDEINERVWVVNPDNDSVSWFDSTDHIAGYSEFDLSALSTAGGSIDPRSVAIDSSGNAWIACHDSDQVLVVSSSGSLIEEINLGYGSAPAGAAPSPDGSSIYITTQARGHDADGDPATGHPGNGQLIRYTASGQSENARLELGPMARPIAVSGDESQILVGRFITGEMFGEIWEVDGSGSGLSFTRTIGLYPHRKNAQSSEGPGIPNYISSITITPDGEWAWYTAKKDNVYEGDLLGETSSDTLQTDTTVRAMVGRIDLSAGQNYDTETAWNDSGLRIDFDNVDSPSAVEFNDRGDWAFVTAQGNNLVGIFDHLDILRSNVTVSKNTRRRFDTGLAPQGLVYDSSTQLLWVKNFMDRTVSVLDISDFLSTGAASASTDTLYTVGSEILSASVLNGKQIFYNASDNDGAIGMNRMSDEGYMSCATCHVDGMHDGRTFDFTQRGEGLRNTTDLRGRAGTGHGNVHWTGNFDEIHDFNLDIVNHFGGQGFPIGVDPNDPLGASNDNGDSDLNDLVAYLESLDVASLPRSPYRNDDGTLTTAAQNGASLFDGTVIPASSTALSCATCHDPDNEYTDSTVGQTVGTNIVLHDVGSIRSLSSGSRLESNLTGIDTPTLLGVWNSAPYLHNGSGELIDDVFEFHGGTEYQFEDGTFSDGNARNYRGAHGGGLKTIRRQNDWAEITDIDGGSGGDATLSIRFATKNGGSDVQVTVNGAQAVDFDLPDTDPSSNSNRGNVAYATLVINATLDPATSNTVRVTQTSAASNGRIHLDSLHVSHVDDLAEASEHRQLLDVKNASQAEYDDVIAYLLQLDGRDLDGNLPGTGGGATVDFENLAAGDQGTQVYDDPAGYTFTSSDGNGNLRVRDASNGYASKVLANANWSQSILITKTGGGSFDLTSFDYATGQAGKTADATVTATFSDSSTDSTTFSSSSLALATLSLNWTDLVEVKIDFRGGANGRSGVIDNVVFGAGGGGSDTPPSIDTDPVGTTVYAGQSATFNVAVSGDPTPTVEWFRDGSTSVGTGTSLTVSSAAASDAGDYTAVATNSVDSATSDAATLTVVTDAGLPDLDGANLGGASVAVSRELASGNYEQAGNGTGPDATSSSNASDQILYHYESISGDFEAIVNLQSLSGGADSRAGLMLREDSDDDGVPDVGDAFVFLGTGTSDGYVQQVRGTEGAAASAEETTQQGGSAIGDSFPDKWVMIRRVGDELNLYTSGDGTTFDLVDTSYTLTGLSDPALIGLATWSGDSATTAVSESDRFSVVELTPGSGLLSESFDGATTVGTGTEDDWVVVDDGTTQGPSSWSISSGELTQTSNLHDGMTSNDVNTAKDRVGTYAYWSDSAAATWSEYTVTADVRSGDDDGIGLMFYLDQANDDYYRFEMDTQRSFWTLVKVVGGTHTLLASDGSEAYTQDNDYRLSISVDADANIVVTREDLTVGTAAVELANVTDSSSPLSEGTIALYSWGNTDAAFDDVSVTSGGANLPTPLVHYEFDENGGSTAGDSSGNSRDGSITGAVYDDTDTPDGSTSALSFDGTGDYVEDADAENFLNGLDAYTFTVWVKASAAGSGDPGIFLTNMPGSDNDTQLRYDSTGWAGGGSSLIKMGTTTSAGNTQGESVSNVQSTSWQHLALTWTSGNEPKLYIDGVLTGWDTDANPANPGSISGTLSSITTLLIGKGGKDNDLTGDSWNGLIDDFRIYDTELTESQITDIYNGN